MFWLKSITVQWSITVHLFFYPGLDILRVINEPTAAAMAYGLHKAEVFNVLVVDLGGGTLDVSLLNKQGGMFLTRAMAGESDCDWHYKCVSTEILPW